ncbi:MAG TPA: hypothetical protein VMU93_09610, partial [Caulobacteraceae bacterium]|nr:hypothetical protein [Caulobacteraceae bacterium]
MFRSTRANARRISLLASSSFVASTVLAGAGGMALTAFTPSVALAATCTPQTEGTYTVPVGSTGGTIVCGPGPAASIGFTSNTAGTNIYMTGNLVVNDGGVLLTSTTAQNLA